MHVGFWNLVDLRVPVVFIVPVPLVVVVGIVKIVIIVIPDRLRYLGVGQSLKSLLLLLLLKSSK